MCSPSRWGSWGPERLGNLSASHSKLARRLGFIQSALTPQPECLSVLHCHWHVWCNIVNPRWVHHQFSERFVCVLVWEWVKLSQSPGCCGWNPGSGRSSCPVLESRSHRPCSVVRTGDMAQWLAGSMAGGAEQVGLWWLLGHLLPLSPQALNPGPARCPAVLLFPAFASCPLRICSYLEMWVQGPFQKESCSPMFPGSSLERERQDHVGSTGGCISLWGSWNASPTCPCWHAGTLPALVRGHTTLNYVLSVQCNCPVTSGKPWMRRKGPVTLRIQLSLYNPGLIGPLFPFSLAKDDFFF